MCQLIAFGTQAQNQLTGKVVDITQKSVEFALVSIHPLNDSTQIKGISTNNEGVFIFSDLNSDNYELNIQMLGYEDWSQQIEISNNTHLKPIILLEEIATLNEVQILANKSALESHLGKKILRIGKDLATTGSNALEALDNIPSITTTPRGQIQIRGNSNVIIYINGKATNRKPSTLKFIAAESLEKIEIITNPSAKYDAEGVGGIINLIFKNDKTSSFKLELVSNLSVPTNPFNLNSNGGINANWTKDKISLYSNLSYDYGKYIELIQSKRKNLQDSLQRFENLNEQSGLAKVSNALVGCSFEPDSTFSIGLEMNYQRWNFEQNIHQQNIFDYKNAIEQSINLSNQGRELEDELWINLSLEKEFKKKQQLKIALTTGGENENNFLKNEDITLLELPSSVQQFLLSTDVLESQRYYQSTIDYETPFFKWGTLETGIKANFIDYSIYQSISLQSDTIQLPNNDFIMNMQKLGIYAIQKHKIRKLEYSLGVRLEQFSSEATQRAGDSRFSQNYVRLFPSVQLNYLIGDRNQTIGFNYTRRINRPGFFDLNPYISFEDPLNLETGNPALQPEFADLFEWNYHQEWERLNLDFTIYSRLTNDAIQKIVKSLNNNQTITTAVNIGKVNNRGIEGQLEYIWSKVFKASGTFVLAQNKFEDSENEINFNQTMTWSLRFKQKLNLKKNWKIELSEVYRAPSFQIQEKVHSNYYIHLAINKKFNNNKGSFSFAVRDVFNTRQYIYSFHTSLFEIERRYKWQTCQITLGLKYNLFDRKN